MKKKIHFEKDASSLATRIEQKNTSRNIQLVFLLTVIVVANPFSAVTWLGRHLEIRSRKL